MPNWKRFIEVAKDLERVWDAEAFQFNIDTFYAHTRLPEGKDRTTITLKDSREGDCGTQCCVGGTAVLMFSELPLNTLLEQIDWEKEAAYLLDLDSRESEWAFYAKWHPLGTVSLSITQKEAANYLRKAAREKDVFVSIHYPDNRDAR
jgi:hypothetical protein